MKRIMLFVFSLYLLGSFNIYANTDGSVSCKDLKEGQEFDGTSVYECFYRHQSLSVVYRAIAKRDSDLIKVLDIMKNTTYKVEEEYSTGIISYKWKTPKRLVLIKNMNDGNEITTLTFNEEVKGTKLTIVVETQY